jgi:hypothetical protein
MSIKEILEAAMSTTIQGRNPISAGNKKMARDPRYSMSMTVDIKPGETQRQAAKFGNKTNKLGRPPILNPSGKIN